MDYNAKSIRNVAIFGHQGSGKTSLVESLYATVYKKEKGSIEKGTTVSDFTAEEKKRLMSISNLIIKNCFYGYLKWYLRSMCLR